MDDDLLDEIYEAAVIPSRWSGLLERLGQRLGSRGGLLFGGSAPDFRWLGGGEVVEHMIAFIEGGWMAHNDRVERTISRRTAGFVADFHSADEMARMPMYTEFLTPRGFDAPIASYAPGLMGDDIVITLEGFPSVAAAHAAVPRADLLRPHLARAGGISAKIGLDRAKAAVLALGSFGVAAAYLGSGGKLIDANSAFQRELGARLNDTSQGLRAHQAGASERLQDVISRIQAGHTVGRSIALRSREDLPPAVLHILPLKREARDVFVGAMALAVVTSGSGSRSLGTGVLESLFDLTAAEARVAALLANGNSIQEVASSRGISPHTAKVHVRNIYGKMGVSRQLDLVLLLQNLALPVDISTDVV